jgi:hypothetical protein
VRRTCRGSFPLWIVGLLCLAACQPAPPAAPTSAPAKPAAQATSPAAAAAASPAALVSPSPSPVAVASPSPSPAALASPSPSPAAATSVSGPIDSIAGRELTVATNTGSRQVQVPESARIEQEGTGTVADLRPGLSVGITGRPDGTARSIRIFPAALGTPRPGQIPMSGPEQGNIMTNAVIESFDGQTLVVSAAGSSFRIAVPPEAEVLKPIPVSFADLAAGKRVIATGTVSPDGTLVAATVNLLGPPPPLAP